MDKVFTEEKNHVEKLKNSINLALSEVEQILKKVGITNLDRLKELKTEGEFGPDFLMFLEQLHEKNAALNLKDKFKRIEELKYLLTQPYFARIDLRKSKSTDNIYIGKFGLSEASTSVTDWRAKIASVYYRYRYPQKNVYYDTPGGVERRDLLLKRTYEISDGELIKYYNNDIQLDENEIIIEKIGKKTGGVLEDIIETIQQSQMDIIESDPRQICIVQGCVGSGKSTVAIHKLAHIFFNYPNLIHSEKSIVVAKNQILVGYLSTLFPRLGIFDINYKTVREILVNLIFREQIQLKTNLDTPGDLKDFKLNDLKKLYISLEKIHASYETKLSDLFKVTEFEPFGGYKYSTNMSPSENINEILTELEEELTNQKDELKELPNDSIKAYQVVGHEKRY
ncbi:MAG: Superfamily I DNA helicase [candidate division WWE3 bacterium GW2011_GWE1_41_27]|uniref:Superfamily I DNA helicase n=1 Tax=candidate division WWE3 bacterium GW2011_GWE1_41_27 TaxID=1619131 RepID=A0A0G0W0Z0_UNCKA|nr:MAG: Superfamily I DNA helicase [candidate division WWE3 bacterium GW2011_GWE1_41_27]